MHENSRLLFQKYAHPYFQPNLRVLEIGPDSFPSTYQAMVNDPSLVWDTLDLTEEARLTYQALSQYRFPIAPEAYDIVLSGQVLEHVRKIWVWIKEVARLCKKGGLVITINPVSWPYHEAPHDCWRVYPEGMRALYEEAGLEVLLSVWGSLEAEPGRPTLPGRSAQFQPQAQQRLYKLLKWCGFPQECSFDTITIGQRPLE